MGTRPESWKQTIRKIFSLSEDVAPNDEIKDRLLSGGKVTGTNMCVMLCAMIFLASTVILSALRIPKVRELTEKEWRRLRFRMIRNTIIILIPSVLVALSIGDAA